MVETNELEISVAEVVNYMRLTGQFQPALREVIRRKIAANSAKDRGIKVTGAELQRLADAFRARWGYFKVADTDAWLQASGLTLEALEEYLETSLLVSKLKDALAEKASRSEVLRANPVKSVVREVAYEQFLQRNA